MSKFADSWRTLPKRGAVARGLGTVMGAEATVNINLTGNRLIRSGAMFPATPGRMHASYVSIAQLPHRGSVAVENFDPQQQMFVCTTASIRSSSLRPYSRPTR